MGKKLTSKPNPNDPNGICNAIAKLDHELNTSASPTFTGIGLTGLTENALMYADSTGVLTSLAAATNGQLIIGSTGSAPSITGLTGTANQIIVTPGAGSITLSTPQDIHTGASPTFAGLTITNAVVIGSNSVVFQPSIDATDFFQILDAGGGTSIFNVDTVNERIGFGTNAPTEKFIIESTENYRANFNVSGTDKRALFEVKNVTDAVTIQAASYGAGYAGSLQGITLAKTAWMTGIAPLVIYGNKRAANGQVVILSHGVEALRIDGSGNIGFGVVDPDAGLEIFRTTTQLKLSYDATNYAQFAVAGDGALTITTVDAAAANGDITFSPDGNTIISTGDVSIANGLTVDTDTLVVGAVTKTVGIKTAATTFPGLNIGSADGSDLIGIYHDNANAFIKWNDGILSLQTDEGTDTNTIVNIIPKGTGRAQLNLDSFIYVRFRQGDLQIDAIPGAAVNYRLFRDAMDGETREFQIRGFRSGDSQRTLEVGVGVDAADTVSFDGLSNYWFDGTIKNTAGRIKNTTRYTTTQAIPVTDNIVFANTDGGAWTATLPAGVEGQTLKIINSGSSGNLLTVAPNGAEHLLGANSNFILFDGESLILTYNATDGWY